MKQLHRHLYLVAVFIVFLPFWPLLSFLKKNSNKHYSTFVRIRKWIALTASSFVGFRYKIKWEEEVDWSRNYIICANHTSNLDITALIKVCKNDFSFIGKDELLNNPVTGLFFRTIDIPVNRSSKMSSFRAFKRAEKYLLEDKSIVIFPEGGIGDEYPPVLDPFKNGVFKLATELKIPILPVIIKDAWELFWDDGSKKGSQAGSIHIQVLKPVDGEALNLHVDDLRDRVYDLFQKNLSSN